MISSSGGLLVCSRVGQAALTASERLRRRKMSIAKKRAFILILALMVAFSASFQLYSLVRADDGTPAQSEDVKVLFFWGDGCPHCATGKVFLEELQNRHPLLVIEQYEVWYVPENREILQQVADELGFDPQYVPVTVVGDQYWVGFSEIMAEEIEQAVVAGLESLPVEARANVINIPLIGRVNLDQQSLLMSTALIAFVDGVNPCSVWVLTMLLALVIHTGSRKKILLIGIIFLTVTAAIYALFIAGLFTLLTFVSFMTWIQVAVALIALAFAVINIKDYFWYKEGVSLTISDKDKPGLMRKMRSLVSTEKSIWGLIGATIAMAAGVSLVEFSCTAGFPVLWTNMLVASGVETSQFVGLLLVYMLIYQLDELVIFLTVIFTLKASRMEEKHGRILKLMGGTLMLTLALIMLINPDLLESLSSSLYIFTGAFLGAVLILLLHRRLLPAMGIYIGSEIGARKPKRKTRVVRRHSR
jgi:thiol-disulfide isomerase/thioredoxin